MKMAKRIMLGVSEQSKTGGNVAPIGSIGEQILKNTMVNYQRPMK